MFTFMTTGSARTISKGNLLVVPRFGSDGGYIPSVGYGSSNTKEGNTMLGNVILMAAMIGQTPVEGPGTGPVLSEVSLTSQARAMAEFRAKQHTVEPRLIANYQLENQRLKDRVQTVDVATSRVWSLTTRWEQYDRSGGRI